MVVTDVAEGGTEVLHAAQRRGVLVAVVADPALAAYLLGVPLHDHDLRVHRELAAELLIAREDAKASTLHHVISRVVAWHDVRVVHVGPNSADRARHVIAVRLAGADARRLRRDSSRGVDDARVDADVRQRDLGLPRVHDAARRRVDPGQQLVVVAEASRCGHALQICASQLVPGHGVRREQQDEGVDARHDVGRVLVHDHGVPIALEARHRLGRVERHRARSRIQCA